VPLTAVVNLGTNGNTGSATITVSPSRNVEVGEFIAVTLTQRDWSLSSVADNSAQAGAANTYTQDKANVFTDPFPYIYSCKVTRKILTTDAIAATFSGTSGGKSMCVMALPDANATSQLDKTATTGSASASSTYTSSAVTTTAQADEYAIGVAVFALSSVNAGTITADSPWTLEHNYKPAGYGAAHGSQVLTATGTPAFTGGWGATEDGVWVAAIATYKGTLSGAQNQLAWIRA
jgi:hypothetical protein